MRIFITILLSFFLTTGFANAQETENYSPFQFSFISPIGTNGSASHLYTNGVSVNILGGYSRATTSFEAASLYNINTEYTRGAQFAGIFNYSGKGENAVQFAGVANVNKQQDKGAQFAGVINVAQQGYAGFQGAGVINVAEDAGAQLAGVLNVAKNVKHVQIGLVNISENCDGVPIGLINVVKNGGKREFEVSFSEFMTTAATFRLGVDKLYTIFTAGVNYIENPVEYAFGIGWGTHINWKDNWANQIELIGYSITQDGKFRSGTNMVAQLRLTVSKQLMPHVKLFAGPTINTTISEYKDPETGKLKDSYAGWSVWKNKSKKTLVDTGIGFVAGVRF